MATGERHYDVIIAGGGMIGTTTALALAPLGLSIAIVEPVPRTKPAQPSFDDRTTALSRSSQRMFSAMGLWPSIAAGATPIRRIHVSDKGRFGFSHIDAEQQRVEALGYVVVNRVLGAVLQEAMRGAAGVDFICPARITAVETAGDAVTVSVTAAGRESSIAGRHTCSLLVVADGARSEVRDMLGITSARKDYGQHAVVGNLRPALPMRNVAYERFTDSGPLALLPLGNDRAAFVWTVSAGEAGRVMDLDDRQFLAEFQDAFGYRAGELTRVGERAAYPLTLTRALRLTAVRSVLVGNAAHGLHPVAAQGFNLGLRDVAALADCIEERLTADAHAGEIGSAALLDNYVDWRRQDQRKLVGFTDGLVRLFEAPQPPVRLLRNLGMLGFDLVPGVREEFARHTMGLAGRLPRLSRGVPLR